MLASGEVPDGNPTIMVRYIYLPTNCTMNLISQVEFRIPQFATSSLKVGRLDLYGEVSVSTILNYYNLELLLFAEIQTFQGNQVYY